MILIKAGWTLIKWAWFLIGVFVMLQYLYWAAREIGYGLSLCPPPTISHLWLFLAFSAAAIQAAERLTLELERLLP